jgi:ribose/xylose/arabinose/galactoside ABC-type transport system permease subunit
MDKRKIAPMDFIIMARQYGIALILLMMIIALLIVSPTFRTLQNTINVLNQVSINGIISIGMTLVIISGGIDISVGSVIALASVICGAVLTMDPNNIALTIVLAVAGCGLVGLFNGFFVARYDMFPFVVTLSSMMIIRGCAYVVSNGKSYVLKSDAFKEIGQGKLFDIIPYSVIVFAGVCLVGYVLLSHTKFGRYLYAVGGNTRAAMASGINVGLIRMCAYMAIGLFTGIAGVLLTSRVNAGQPAIGVGYETDAIAATVIGGVSLNGGVGTIGGTVIGILIIGIINNGMNLIGVSSFYQQIVKGFIILGAVVMDIKISRHKAA